MPHLWSSLKTCPGVRIRGEWICPLIQVVKEGVPLVTVVTVLQTATLLAGTSLLSHCLLLSLCFLPSVWIPELSLSWVAFGSPLNPAVVFHSS